MAKPIAVRTLKVMGYLRNNPDTSVAKVAGKFGMSLSQVYSIRKRVRAEDAPPLWNPPELLPVPEIDEAHLFTKEEADLMCAPQTTDVDDVLNDRAKDYGKFIEGAEIMQMLKRLVHNYIEQRGTPLAFDQREAIDMIIHKLGRIINGNPDKVDHWTDIAGYAKLVADRLEGNVR